MTLVVVAPARVDDEWHEIRRCRAYLIKEMDAKRMMPAFSGKDVRTFDLLEIEANVYEASDLRV